MSEEKPKPGRPRVRPENPVPVRCELSPAEHEAAQKAAQAAGVSLAVFARLAVTEKTRKVLKRS